MSIFSNRQKPVFILYTIFFSLWISLGSHSSLAQGNSYPNKPVKMITPVAAGGGLDNIARALADRLTRATGQSFIVDNQGGGGGVIASLSTAKAAPDGYTLMVAYVGSHGTNPATRKLPFDAIKDFTPIGLIGATPNVLVINQDLPIKTLKEFVAYAQKNPARFSYGSAGPGTLTHLAMEQFKHEAKFFCVHVPYRGIAPAFTDLMGGQTQAMFPSLFAALPYINTNKMRALAVTGPKRNPVAPNIPTFKELGYEGFEGQQWYGLIGPAKLPEPIVTKLNAELNKILSSPEFFDKFSSEAFIPMPTTPQQFGTYMKDDIARWSKLVKDRNIEIE